MAALDETTLQGDVAAARRGDRDALERVVRAIQDPIYHLAMRMLGHPDDARDASQEVLVRVVTKLDSFRGDSRFMTWVYRVATNALLDTRKALQRRESTFDELGSALDAAVAAWSPQSPPVDRLVLDEAKQVCTQGMLLCSPSISSASSPRPRCSAACPSTRRARTSPRSSATSSIPAPTDPVVRPGEPDRTDGSPPGLAERHHGRIVGARRSRSLSTPPHATANRSGSSTWARRAAPPSRSAISSRTQS